MTPEAEHRRRQAVARYLAGDPIDDICRHMKCSKSWLYKMTVARIAWPKSGRPCADL
jgi:hypothetical protein